MFSCLRQIERLHGLAEMARRKVLVPHRHPRVPMTKDFHDGALRDAIHRQGARRIVPQIVEPNILQAKAMYEASEASGQHDSGSVAAGARRSNT